MRYQWTKADVQVIKAAWASDQGRAALQLVVERMSGLHRSSFNPDGMRMAFLEGRRSVGIDLATAINTPLDHMTFEETNDGNDNRPITATERLARTVAERAEGGRNATRKRLR